MKKKEIEKQERGPAVMEVFLLAMIAKAEKKTFYALQRDAGLSPGSILAPLKRLEETRLVERGQAGSRQKQEYSVTPAGRQALKVDWEKHLFKTSADAETLLRNAWVASFFNLAAARGFLQGASIERKRQMDTEDLKPTITGADPARTYQWMKRRLNRARLEAEAKILAEIAEELEAMLGERNERYPRKGTPGSAKLSGDSVPGSKTGHQDEHRDD